MKKYQLNLFEPHIKLVMEALEKHCVDVRIMDFIMIQIDMQNKNEELSKLHLAYEKHLSAYEPRQQGAQH
jgi:hypothetical protein